MGGILLSTCSVPLLTLVVMNSSVVACPELEFVVKDDVTNDGFIFQTTSGPTASSYNNGRKFNYASYKLSYQYITPGSSLTDS